MTVDKIRTEEGMLELFRAFVFAATATEPRWSVDRECFRRWEYVYTEYTIGFVIPGNRRKRKLLCVEAFPNTAWFYDLGSALLHIECAVLHAKLITKERIQTHNYCRVQGKE